MNRYWLWMILFATASWGGVQKDELIYLMPQRIEGVKLSHIDESGITFEIAYRGSAVDSEGLAVHLKEVPGLEKGKPADYSFELYDHSKKHFRLALTIRGTMEYTWQPPLPLTATGSLKTQLIFPAGGKSDKKWIAEATVETSKPPGEDQSVELRDVRVRRE